MDYTQIEINEAQAVLIRTRRDPRETETTAIKRMAFEISQIKKDAIKSINLENIKTESAEQARKESANIAVAWVDNNLNSTGDVTREEFTSLRADILGDSVIKENLTTEHVPDAGKLIEEKLAIAARALKEIRNDACRLFDIHHPSLDAGYGPTKDIINIVDKTLKEIQK